MIKDNMEMMKELADSSSLYDYDTYRNMCKDRGIVVRPIDQYLNGISVLEYGLLIYGGDWQEAYLKAFEAINDEPKGDTQCCGDKPKEKEVKPLGIVDTVKSLSKSVKDHVRNKLSHVSNTEFMRRAIICSKCKWIEEGFKCGQCHCYMGIKATWDIEGICKLKKW